MWRVFAFGLYHAGPRSVVAQDKTVFVLKKKPEVCTEVMGLEQSGFESVQLCHFQIDTMWASVECFVARLRSTTTRSICLEAGFRTRSYVSLK